jgi:hypothetical protein
MFARHITLHLKPNFEKEILPIQRREERFLKELLLVAPLKKEAVAITLWGQRLRRSLSPARLSCGLADHREIRRGDTPHQELRSRDATYRSSQSQRSHSNSFAFAG